MNQSTGQERIARLEQEAEKEASLSPRKFIKLLQLRLITQGVKPTLYWMNNLFNRIFFDRPVRDQIEITPPLFVGPQFKQRGWQRLKSWGIDSVVNMRTEFDDLSLGVEIPHYLHIPLPDDTAPSLEQLAEGVRFITERINAGGKVYIHCGAGVGRAPTMAAAYLISQGMSFGEAERLIQEHRCFIRMVRAQKEVLREYEASLTVPEASY